MDDARQIRQRFETVMERMGQPVRLLDQRLGSPDTLHRGYLTKGPGAEAGWEFRFLSLPLGMQAGSLLTLDDGARWRVQSIHQERDGQELLFVSAAVSNLDSEPAPLREDLASHLQDLQRLLGASTLGPLEHDDAAEALQRLSRLAADQPSPAVTQRIHSRLKLLADRFKACPQTSHEAKGRLLKLEAHLKRKGLS